MVIEAITVSVRAASDTIADITVDTTVASIGEEEAAAKAKEGDGTPTPTPLKEGIRISFTPIESKRQKHLT